MPASMREWLAPSDPVWLVISAVESLDTSVLHRGRNIGGAGRAGYDPDMLLTLLVWAWAQGVRSSRVIERLCTRDVAYRVICAGDTPDHVTISRFRAQAGEACEDLFASVLALCARLGMGQLGVVAIDSVKIASNASLAANRCEDGLRRAAAEQSDIDRAKARQLAATAAAEHAATDAAEDDLYGCGSGDEMPEDLVDPSSRARRIAEAIAQLKADTAAGGRDREAAAARKQQRTEQKQAKRATLVADYRGARERGGPLPRGAVPAELCIEALTHTLAVRKMPLRGGGWLQGYNCQAATSSDGLIIATSVGNNPSDATAFTTIMDKTVAAAEFIDAHQPTATATTATSTDTEQTDAAIGIGIVLLDAGYLSTDNLTAPGPDRLIAVGKSHDLASAAKDDPTTGRPPPQATPIEAMAHRLRTPEGHALYKQRSHIAETPFAHAKHNLGFRRFTSRGIDRAAAEFSFHALVHNLFKAIGAATLTPTTA